MKTTPSLLPILVVPALLLAGGGPFRVAAQEPAPRGDPAALFQQLNANGDGSLSKDEFKKKFGELGQGKFKDRPEVLDRLFERLDADRSGALSAEEFKALGAMRKRKSAATPAPAPPKTDADKPAAAAGDSREHAEPQEGTVARFDADKDGKLSAEEMDALQAFVEKMRKERVEAGKAQTALLPLKGADLSPEQKNYQRAADYSAKLDGHAVLIRVDGQVVFERYDNGQIAAEPHLIHSATKTFWGSAVAAMIEDGLISSLDERVANTITEWKDIPHKGTMTIRHLVTLTSGLEHDLALLHSASRQSRKVPDVYKAALDMKSVAEPGVKFRYGPADFYVLGEVMKRKLAARKQTPLDYLQARILDPIGVKAGPWVFDPAGNPHIPGRGTITARDWATYGQFLLNGGGWNGKQIVKKELLHFEGSQANPGFGLTAWLNAPGGSGVVGGGIADARAGKGSHKAGWIYPDGYPDLFMAAGAGKNRLYVIPSRNMVVARLGESRGYSDAAFLGLVLEGKEPTPGALRAGARKRPERPARH
jgi:CubicO group peptidase (beta-lactamase class C family)